MGDQDKSEDVFREYLSRSESGEDVDPEEYLRKYPELADELRVLFNEMDKNRDTDLDPARSGKMPLVIGDFKIIAQIGRGGMGTVYEAEQVSLNRRVALKVLPSHLSVSKEAVKKFEREAEAGGRQSHPGIVAIYTYGEHEGVYYIAQELVEGGQTLKNSLDRFREFEDQEAGYFRETALLISEVADALEHAHRTGVIHRDVKPSNILLTAEGRPKVTDFGLAKVEDALALSRTGDFAGTPYYMSPEQAMSRRIGIDKRTDIYSLGATLYEMLTLRRPFEGKTSHEVLKKIILVEPMDPHKVNPIVPWDLSVICLKAMEKVPEERYQSMGEFADDLRRFRSGDVIMAKPAGIRTKIWKRVKRNPLLSVSVSVTILSVLVVLLFILLVLPWMNWKKEKEKAEELQAKNIEIEALRVEASAERDNARRERDRAEELLGKFTKLSDLRKLRELEYTGADLWPAHPDKIDDYRAWLAKANELKRHYDDHRRDLEELRKSALPYTEEARRRDRANSNRWNQLQDSLKEKKQLEEEFHRIEGESHQQDKDLLEKRASLEKSIEKVDGIIAKLNEQVSANRTWHFENETDRWRHFMLTDLVKGIANLSNESKIQNTIGEIEDRLTFAASVRKKSIDDHREMWDLAIRSIGDETECPMYRGLDFKELVGFVPLGPDPDSGLWEFAHVQTGEIPVRDDRGRLKPTDRMCLVFVLIPGGQFDMGAVRPSENNPPGSPNVDSMAMGYEGPVHRVTVDPFLISKYEMTQWQWYQYRNHNPSVYYAGSLGTTWHDPVEYVSHRDCFARLWQLGLELPSEAQWEYACRAGTSTVFWTGDDMKSLRDAANVQDVSFRESDTQGRRLYEDWIDDGYRIHAPVGSFLPNAFGLHDVHGNVSEWCIDVYVDSYDFTPRDGSPKYYYGSPCRIIRGGSYRNVVDYCRSASRSWDLYTERKSDFGVRPVYNLK